MAAAAVADTIIARMLGALSVTGSIRLPLAPLERTNKEALRLVTEYFRSVGHVGWLSPEHTHLLFTPGVILARVEATPTPPPPPPFQAVIVGEDYRCMCDARFGTAAAMQAHMGREHFCGACQRLVLATRLKQHQCEQFPCTPCGRSFATAFGLSVHRRHAHKTHAQSATCGHCHTDFGTADRLMTHLDEGCSGPTKRKRPLLQEEEEEEEGGEIEIVIEEGSVPRKRPRTQPSA